MAGNLGLPQSALEAAQRDRGYKASYSDTPPPLVTSAQAQRGRSGSPDYQSLPMPFLRRRDSSASSVRSMIDDRMRLADEERGRSRCGTPIAAPSPFRSGSPFEQEYASSRRGSTSHDISPRVLPPILPVHPSIVSGDKAQSGVCLPKIDYSDFRAAIRGWCVACQVKNHTVCPRSLPGRMSWLIRKAGKEKWASLPARM